MSDLEVHFVNANTNESADATIPRQMRGDEIVGTLRKQGFIPADNRPYRLSVVDYGDVPDNGGLDAVVPKDAKGPVTIRVATMATGGA